MADNGFEELMQAWFSASTRNDRKAEWDIQGIAHVLQRAPNTSWSRIPRIYSVLRIIDQLKSIDCFLIEGVSDVGFPFTSRSLPSSLRDNTTRSAFLSAQDLVFNTKAQDLERERTRHCHFRDASDIPLKKIEELGKGAYGFVDRVVSTISHKEYARKLIPRGKTFKKDKEVLRSFERELANLKKISTHKHIVQLVASYTDSRYVGILTSPVADCNLHEYLRQQLDSGKRSFLRGFFGCLTSAVCFLHDNQVRHKDIKPQNVLVKGDCVFLTDFGLALDWSERKHSVTTGPSFSTPRYGAPEVVSDAPRSSPADIWSLGCVFLEIWTLLRGESKQSLELHLHSTGSCSLSYCLNSAGVDTWIESIVRRPGSAADDAPVAWIKNMLQRDQAARCTAHELEEKIQMHDEDPTTPFAFTGRCCSHDEDTAESVYSTCDEDIEDTAKASKTPTSKQHSEEKRKAKEERGTTGPTWDLPQAPPDASPASVSSRPSSCAPDSSSQQQHRMFEVDSKSMHTPPGIEITPEDSDTPRNLIQIPKENTTHESINRPSHFEPYAEEECVSLAAEIDGTQADMRGEASATKVKLHLSQPYVEDESVSLARETDGVPCKQADPPPQFFDDDAAVGSEAGIAGNAGEKVSAPPPNPSQESSTVPLPAEDDGWGDGWGSICESNKKKKKKKKKDVQANEALAAALKRVEEQEAELKRLEKEKAERRRLEETKAELKLLEEEEAELKRIEEKEAERRREKKSTAERRWREEEGAELQCIEEEEATAKRFEEKKAELKREAEIRNNSQRTEQIRPRGREAQPDTVHSNGKQWVFFSSGTNRRYACKDCSDPAGKVSLSCGHIVCRTCLTSKITLSVESPQHMPPRCCGTEIALTAGQIAMHLEPNLSAKWFRKYREYKSSSRDFCEPTADNVLFCPKETCKEWIIPSKIRVDRQSGKRFVRCTHCFTPVCLNCGLKFHTNGYCTRLASRRRRWEMCWQICPKCIIPSWNTCKCEAFEEGVHDTQDDHDILSITSEERGYDSIAPKEEATEVPVYSQYPEPPPTRYHGYDYYHLPNPQGQQPQPSYINNPYGQNPFEEPDLYGHALPYDRYQAMPQPSYRVSPPPPPPPGYYDVFKTQPDRPSGRRANSRSRNRRTNADNRRADSPLLPQGCETQYGYQDRYTYYDKESDHSAGTRTPLNRKRDNQPRTRTDTWNDDESHTSVADSRMSAVAVINRERESALAGLSYGDALNSPERILEWLLHISIDHDITQKTKYTDGRSECGDDGYTDSSETFIESDDDYWDTVEA